MKPEELEKYLHEQIPASKLLEVHVKACSKEKVELTAPLAPNINHKNTAFGGSLSTLAILAGWSLVFMRLRGVKNEIVIQESNMSFLKPAHGDFYAVSVCEESKEWERFDKLFQKRGIARIHVESKVFCNGEVVADFAGNYVAFKKE